MPELPPEVIADHEQFLDVLAAEQLAQLGHRALGEVLPGHQHQFAQLAQVIVAVQPGVGQQRLGALQQPLLQTHLQAGPPARRQPPPHQAPQAFRDALVQPGLEAQMGAAGQQRQQHRVAAQPAHAPPGQRDLQHLVDQRRHGALVHQLADPALSLDTVVIETVHHLAHQLRNAAAQLHLHRVLAHRDADLLGGHHFIQAHLVGLGQQGVQLLFQPVVHAVRVEGLAEMGDQRLK